MLSVLVVPTTILTRNTSLPLFTSTPPPPRNPSERYRPWAAPVRQLSQLDPSHLPYPSSAHAALRTLRLRRSAASVATIVGLVVVVVGGSAGRSGPLPVRWGAIDAMVGRGGGGSRGGALGQTAAAWVIRGGRGSLSNSCAETGMSQCAVSVYFG